MVSTSAINILEDDLGTFAGKQPIFVTFGETMVRDTPADMQRAERTRQIDISLSGSEHILCVGLNRLGIPTRYITRAPDNPYGWMLRNVSREQGIDTIAGSFMVPLALRVANADEVLAVCRASL